MCCVLHFRRLKAGLLCGPPAWASWVSSVWVCSTVPSALHVFVTFLPDSHGDGFYLGTVLMTEFTFAESGIGIIGLGGFTNCWEDFLCWAAVPILKSLVMDGEFLSGHSPEERPWQWQCRDACVIAALSCVWLRQVCSSPGAGALLVPWNLVYFRIGCVFRGETLQFSLFWELVLAVCSAS